MRNEPLVYELQIPKFLSRVLRSSTPRYVCRLVSRLVGRPTQMLLRPQKWPLTEVAVYPVPQSIDFHRLRAQDVRFLPPTPRGGGGFGDREKNQKLEIFFLIFTPFGSTKR